MKLIGLNRNSPIARILELWAYLYGIGMTAITLHTYFSAYLTSSKTVVVHVNAYGEASWEPYLIIISLLFAIVGWIIWIKNYDELR